MEALAAAHRGCLQPLVSRHGSDRGSTGCQPRPRDASLTCGSLRARVRPRDQMRCFVLTFPESLSTPTSSTPRKLTLHCSTSFSPSSSTSLASAPALGSPALVNGFLGQGKCQLSPRQQRRVPRPRGSSSVQCNVVGDHPSVPLPYNYDVLSPHLSEATLRFHHDHYLGCLRKLNSLLDEDDALKRLPMEDLIKSAYNNGNPLPSFNWAAETWNHQFFWTSLSPGGGDARPPSEELTELLDRDFGGLAAFKQQFRNTALSCFGSGWIWLSAKVETLVPEEWLRDLPAHNPYRLTVAKLTIEKTTNALNPIIFDRIPLLALDMWEHAYFNDYKADRAAYVDAFLNHLLSWDTVVVRMENAKALVNFTEMPTPKESLFHPGYIGDYKISDAPFTKEKALATLRESSGFQGNEQ